MRIFILLIFILSLFSCSNEVIPGEREIHFVSIADDFYNYNGNGRKLENVITDQAALIMQLQTFGDILSVMYPKMERDIPPRLPFFFL